MRGDSPIELKTISDGDITQSTLGELSVIHIPSRQLHVGK